MKQTRPQIRYSEEFKRMVVTEIETGIMTMAQASRYYGIGNTLSLYKWINLYGMNAQKGKKVLVMTHKEENELISLRRDLALLKKQLEEAEMRAIAWESMVEAIELDLGIPVKKKPWNQALSEARQKLYGINDISVSKATVNATESPNKPITKEKQPLKRK